MMKTVLMIGNARTFNVLTHAGLILAAKMQYVMPWATEQFAAVQSDLRVIHSQNALDVGFCWLDN